MQSRTFSADAVLENLRDPDTEPFVKFVFHEPGKENGPFIIQYIGNDEISQAHAHRLPFRPERGELYKLKGEGVKAQDWRADGHRWINKGTVALPRKNPKIKKKSILYRHRKWGVKRFCEIRFP